MLESKSRCWVEIDLSKIAENLKRIQHHIGKQKIMAVVKANAYGHGDVQVAKVLQDEGIDFFAVSSIDEAVRLREAKIEGDILILGYTPEEHFHYLCEYHITQCIMSLAYAKKLDTYAKAHNCEIMGHVKVDTGMGRLGIPCQDDNYLIDEVIEVYKLKNLNVTGIFSHFSVADTYEDPNDEAYTQHQIVLYEKVLADLKTAKIIYGVTHLQNSYGALNYPELTYDYARVGILLVGNTSNDEQQLKHPITLIPSLEWKANISCIKTVPKGTYIGYGKNYLTKGKEKIVTVTCGYADGLNRQASHHHLHVLINGERCEIVGNICMDQFMVNATGVKNIEIGNVVTIVGNDGNEVIKIDELSRAANTINNESFCLISKRVPRFYK
ncbi:serine/alanine racemase [Breznakia sp. PF5-3]|uniref:alanine racemase n=1 Tax=unclassified Breznakia TaxID=2623764 RepID=UPI002407582B|nr:MULTISPECIES: alanine racemase [unclassified Breznakia]MDF9824599.1 serine/alanine racemase [Breznakia sp. PM6-1]MDF9835535.1 serine/alanine racemase [Breznakia sp. PF5-3]MDF9837963.1 serine/alanine racemase [Breznakia sp. PFB2-8]MDF9859952.1 serine/alanine racemase [Breznakia sp. PH5-24]